MSLHSLWRKVPHGLRRAVFDETALALGRWTIGRQQSRGEGPVTVVGALRSPTGLGEAARLVLEGLRASGRDARAIDLTEPLRQPAVVSAPVCPAAEPGPGALIVVLNPPVSSYALWLIGRDLARGKRRMGHFVWEYERVPTRWAAHARLFDAVAAPSAFCQKIFEQSFGRAVGVLPYPAAVNRHIAVRSHSGANASFKVAFVGDLIAAAGRKNPLACVDAVGRAFPADPTVELLLILGGGYQGHPVRIALEARAAALGVKLVVDDRHLDAPAHAARLADCDVYLSLHRAEGFALTVIEAMLAGCPVVATGAPPLDEHLTNETGFPISWDRTPAPAIIDLREPGDWAEPDVESAANALRHVRFDPEGARKRAQRVQVELMRKLGGEAFSRNLEAVLR